ncbi:MAG: hypothetical protein ND895_28030 [Pyrinomonadaceae bacterium]|nr:hypothetical protein [Pyrinomonadaceae bacterium]
MMSVEMSNDHPPIDEVSRAIARIQTGVLTIVFALLCGFGLFLMTAWLLLRDGPNVGAHLQLLGNYFPGYSVTWPGSVIGFLYGALVGGLVGWSIGTIYNKVVGVRHVKR